MGDMKVQPGTTLPIDIQNAEQVNVTQETTVGPGGATTTKTTIEITDLDGDGRVTLPPDYARQTGLNSAGGGGTSSVYGGMTSSQAGELRNMSITLGGNPQASGALQSRWASFIGDLQKNGYPVDVNALVQEVMREAYQQNTEDLRFYAEKVQFFNELKKEIRAEATRVRNELAKLAGKPDSAPCNVEKKTFNDTVTTTDQQRADAAASMDGVGKTGENADLSGTGITEYKPGDTPGLVDENGNAVTIAPPQKAFKTDDGIFVITPKDGYYNLTVYDKNGNEKSEIWGDPHVQEGKNNGTEGCGAWSFSGDSTFIIGGTKIDINTQQYGSDENVRTASEITIMSGDQEARVGSHDGRAEGDGTIKDDRAAVDAADADSEGPGSGVFIMKADMSGWNISLGDGTMKDVKAKEWSAYKGSKTVEGDGTAEGITGQSLAAMTDGKTVGKDACHTKAELEAYSKDLESQLNTVGDDAQLANVDLQNMLQKQQQTLQSMSNISKMLHDTAMAVIRKIGG